MARYRFQNPDVEWRLFCGRKRGPKSIHDFVVLIDSRESTPWRFPAYPTKTVQLPAGDYSIAVQKLDDLQTLEGLLLIERKASIDDLLHCMSTDRKRFVETLKTLSKRILRAVICEFPMEDFLRQASRSLSPQAAWHTIVSWSVRYAPFLFCPSAEMAKDAFLYLAAKAKKEFFGG